jgi:hypothetical protein
MKFRIFGFVLVLVGFFGNPIRADIIAHDSFDYAQSNGSTITGANGGVGWNTGYVATGAVNFAASGLAFNGFDSTGGAVRYGANGTLSNGGRSFATAAGGLSGKTLWYSFLVKPELGGRGTFAPFMANNSNQNGLGIRIDVTGTAANSTTQFKAWNVTQSAGANITYSNAFDQTFFVLGKVGIGIGANGTSTNQLWVFDSNATIPIDEAGLVGLTNTSLITESAANTALLTAGWGGRAFGNQSPFASNNLTFDEIRVTTSFSSAMAGFSAVPEPTSLFLMSCIIAVAGIRQFRSRAKNSG